MASLIVLFWRDIPAQVIVRAGRQSAKRELPLRFTEAIDRAAMRAGAHSRRARSLAAALSPAWRSRSASTQ
jgi:hypothetical protein